MADHDRAVGGAERARRAHIDEVARAEGLGPHHAHERGPAEEQHDAQEPPEIGLDHAREDDEEEEHRQSRPDLDEALAQEVDLAAEIALHQPREHAHDRAQHGEHQAEQHRDAEAVDEAGRHVARLVVGAEPIAQRRRRRRRHAQTVHFGVVAEGDERPDQPALVADELLDLGVAVVRLGREDAAEGGLRIVEEHRHEEMAVVEDEERAVVGDELGEQAQDEEQEEEPERPEAAPVGAEVGEPARVDRREPERQAEEARGRCHLSSPAPRNRCAGRPGRR